MKRMGDLAERLAPVEETILGADIFDRFQSQPDLMAIAVIDARRRPVGLLERNAFGLVMGSAYGRALYAGRPIARVMDAQPLVVDASRQVSDVAAETLAGRPSDLLKGIVVVENGRYLGVATVIGVIKALNDQSQAQARKLRQLASGLSLAQGEAQTANALLKEALDAMTEGVAIFDAAGRCVLWNSRYAEVHQSSAEGLRPGAPFEEVLGRGLRNGQYVDAKGREAAWLRERLVRRRALTTRCSEEQHLSDGRFVRVEDTRLATGGVISVAVDVTEIRAQEASFRLLFQSNPVPLAVFDRRTLRFLAVNRAALDQYGYTEAMFLNLTAADVVAPEDRRATLVGLRTRLLDGYAGERTFRHLSSSGERLHVRPFMRPLLHQGRSAMLVAALDVTAQRRAEEGLTLAVREAQAANLAKSEFLANMSHEIRTPLNGVLGVASVLAATELSPAQKEMVGIVTSSARTLQALLNDLLDVAKIEAGQLELQAEVLSLSVLVRNAAALFAPLASAKGLDFRVEVSAAADQLLEVDGVRLTQIISNLCSNAIKFTERGEVVLSVDVRAEAEGLMIEVAVVDTGIGIPEEARARLFERFSQADGSITRRFGGTGLGLAISQQLAAMMGGAIAVASKEGEGSAFTLRVPATVAGAEAPAADQAASAAGADDFGRRLKVLLVEDHPVNRQVVQLMIGASTDLSQAANGAEGLAATERDTFDLILMDMQMPVLDGLSATRAIRRREAARGGPRTPIIMLTANVLADHVELCRAAGADLHLSKPVTAQALYAAMETALSGAAASAAAGASKERIGPPGAEAGRRLRPDPRG